MLLLECGVVYETGVAQLVQSARLLIEWSGVRFPPPVFGRVIQLMEQNKMVSAIFQKIDLNINDSLKL